MTILDEIDTRSNVGKQPTSPSSVIVAAERPEDAKPTTSRLKLSALERVAAGGLALGEDDVTASVLRETLAWAEALDDEATREAARLRFVAKALAATRARCLVIERLRDHYLMAGHAAETRLAQRVLDGETRRLAVLLAEHRHSCASERRSVTVAVGRVDTVNIAAGVRG